MNHSKDLLADEKYYGTKEGIGQDDTGEEHHVGMGVAFLVVCSISVFERR